MNLLTAIVVLLGPVGVVFLLGEVLARHTKVSAEASRKFIHVLSGVWISQWLWAASRYGFNSDLIILASVLLGIGVLLVRFELVHLAAKKILTENPKLKRAVATVTSPKAGVYRITRSSLGDIFYPTGVLMSYLLVRSSVDTSEAQSVIFMAMVLYIALCDGVAALLGKRFGAGACFRFGPLQKSVVGSLSFFVSALLVNVLLFGDTGMVAISGISLVHIALLATAAECISPYGLDNLVLPVVVFELIQLFAV